MPESERIGILEAQLHAHFKADELGFERINQDTSEIKDIVRGMASDLKASVERIHSRVDEEAGKARHALANATMSMQGELKAVSAEARNGTALAVQAASVASDGIKEAKVWALTGIGGVLLTVVAWLAQFIFGAHK